MELGLRGLDLGIVRGVDHIYHSLRVFIVCIPCGPEVLLATQVPDLQLKILVGNFFNVTPDSGLCDDDLIEREFIENSCLSCVIHTHNDNLVLLIALAEFGQLAEQCRQIRTHCLISLIKLLIINKFNRNNDRTEGSHA